jgi:hypothetical protein
MKVVEDLPKYYRAQQLCTAAPNGHLLSIARSLQLTYLHKTTISASKITEPTIFSKKVILHGTAP